MNKLFFSITLSLALMTGAFAQNKQNKSERKAANRALNELQHRNAEERKERNREINEEQHYNKMTGQSYKNARLSREAHQNKKVETRENKNISKLEEKINHPNRKSNYENNNYSNDNNNNRSSSRRRSHSTTYVVVEPAIWFSSRPIDNSDEYWVISNRGIHQYTIQGWGSGDLTSCSANDGKVSVKQSENGDVHVHLTNVDYCDRMSLTTVGLNVDSYKEYDLKSRTSDFTLSARTAAKNEGEENVTVKVFSSYFDGLQDEITIRIRGGEAVSTSPVSSTPVSNGSDW